MKQFFSNTNCFQFTILSNHSFFVKANVFFGIPLSHPRTSWVMPPNFDISSDVGVFYYMT